MHYSSGVGGACAAGVCLINSDNYLDTLATMLVAVAGAIFLLYLIAFIFTFSAGPFVSRNHATSVSLTLNQATPAGSVVTEPSNASTI